ncbi:hypothetical protein AB0K12_20525 [Nonomuraea sp. NPDC049419]|uniref:hypothetical protein n=1 Tax=Nonomuraea sp. NPDC049419 TaxID=3155772 RepID=UPI00341829F8
MSWRLRALWIAAVGLVAATLGLTFARLLEMPVGLAFDTTLRVHLNDRLYPRLTYASGLVEALAVIAATALAIAERGMNRFCPTVLAAALVIAAFVLWLVVVHPVNGVFASWTPQSVPGDWRHWRLRWAQGQVGGSVLLSSALILLLVALAGPRRSAVSCGARQPCGR